MKRIIGAIWGVLICTLITLCSCKTKKAVQVESVKRTFDSAQVVKEQANVKYSLVDTSRIGIYHACKRVYIRYALLRQGKLFCSRHEC